MSIQKECSPDGRVEFHIEDISSWNGFEDICNYLVEYIGAKLLSQNDGPDARVWKLKYVNKVIIVVHDDVIGNYFFAELPEGQQAAEDLAKLLTERIKTVNG